MNGFKIRLNQRPTRRPRRTYRGSSTDTRPSSTHSALDGFPGYDRMPPTIRWL